MVDEVAKSVATSVVVPVVQESIMGDAAVNGTHDPARDYTGIVPRIKVYEAGEAGLYVGIPDSDPAAQEAHEMEYGSMANPPAPHLRKAVSEAHEQANTAFYDRLVAG